MIVQPTPQERRRYGGRKWCGPPPPPFGVGTRLLGPEAPVIPPIPLPGMTLWLKPSSYAAPTWTDVSAGGTNAFQATSGPTSPTAGTGINGHPSVDFNGTSQFLNGVSGVHLGSIIDPTGEFWTAFVVFNYLGSTAVSPPFGDPTLNSTVEGSWGCLVGKSGGSDQAYGMNGYASSPNFGIIVSGLSVAPHIMAFRQNGVAAGDVMSFAVDGVAAPTAGVAQNAGVANTMAIGKDGFGVFLHGSLGDIIVWNVALTDSQVTGVFQNLGAKYGIAV